MFKNELLMSISKEVIVLCYSLIFCLSPAADTPSSARSFDSIVSGCIPVIVSDELELPFEGILDHRINLSWLGGGGGGPPPPPAEEVQSNSSLVWIL